MPFPAAAPATTTAATTTAAGVAAASGSLLSIVSPIMAAALAAVETHYAGDASRKHIVDAVKRAVADTLSAPLASVDCAVTSATAAVVPPQLPAPAAGAATSSSSSSSSSAPASAPAGGVSRRGGGRAGNASGSGSKGASAGGRVVVPNPKNAEKRAQLAALEAEVARYTAELEQWRDAAGRFASAMSPVRSSARGAAAPTVVAPASSSLSSSAAAAVSGGGESALALPASAGSSSSSGAGSAALTAPGGWDAGSDSIASRILQRYRSAAEIDAITCSALPRLMVGVDRIDKAVRATDAALAGAGKLVAKASRAVRGQAFAGLEVAGSSGSGSSALVAGRRGGLPSAAAAIRGVLLEGPAPSNADEALTAIAAGMEAAAGKEKRRIMEALAGSSSSSSSSSSAAVAAASTRQARGGAGAAAVPVDASSVGAAAAAAAAAGDVSMAVAGGGRASRRSLSARAAADIATPGSARKGRPSVPAQTPLILRKIRGKA